jgi:nitroimidazol reductase NimA-like FMN-containing flavoprotein (pyridoxamine 5'-phosphate oxidase superfamily)
MMPTPARRPPTFHTLSRDECLALLNRHDVGRIAYAFHDRVDIQPVHYVYSAGFLYGRTAEGAKLDTIAHNRWVAFEVDEVRGTFDWASVVVHGAFYRLDLGAVAPKEREVAERAAALLDNVVPNTLALGDPVPFRTVLFRVHADEVSGRRATPSA